jgi:hypothetical protein
MLPRLPGRGGSNVSLLPDLVRAGSPDRLVIRDHGAPCRRPLACHLHPTGRPNADCSLSTTSVDRRGPPPMPRAEPGIHGLNR